MGSYIIYDNLENIDQSFVFEFAKLEIKAIYVLASFKVK